MKEAYFTKTSRGYRIKALLVTFTVTMTFLSLLGLAFAFFPGTTAFLITGGFNNLFGTAFVFSDTFLAIAPWIMAISAIVPNWGFTELKIGLLVSNISDYGLFMGIAMLSQEPPVDIDNDTLSDAQINDWTYAQTVTHARQKGLAGMYHSAIRFFLSLFLQPTQNLGMKAVTLLGLAFAMAGGFSLFMLAYPLLLNAGISITALRLLAACSAIAFAFPCTEPARDFLFGILSLPSTFSQQAANVWNHIIGPMFGAGDYKPVSEDIREALHLGKNPEGMGLYSFKHGSDISSDEDDVSPDAIMTPPLLSTPIVY